MKRKTNFLIIPLLIMGVLLIFGSGCKKEEDDDGKNNGNNTDNTFTDPRDGNVYKTVTIGDQVWMAENLRYLTFVTKPADGCPSTSLFYVYGYNDYEVNDAKATTNYTTYGVLYNWSAVIGSSGSSNANPSGVQGICPPGWHLPSDAEWTQLNSYLGSSAGGKLKATGTIEAGTGLWHEPNAGASNESGFTGLPGGSRRLDNQFGGLGNYGQWWSATEFVGGFGNYHAWYHFLAMDKSNFTRSYTNKENGFSVRCVKD